ncbi:MAG: DUF1501 domain-containing protein [Verrucomicrobia bacterium]|nr:DUF1501 domain-containing protein [Verrucomicrobiota bacterium]
MAPHVNGSLSLRDGITRRELLRAGGLGCLGLALPSVLRGATSTKTKSVTPSFGRAKSCIILFLTGGPPQHETFDPKPDAPREIRGELKSISTSVPGLHFGELLPRTARIADRLAVIRSMTTDINSHSTSGYWMLTGYPHESKAESLPPGPTDWPSIASVVGALKPSARSPFSAAVLPEPIVNNPNIPWPGQDGGFMGHTWNPFLFKCDPSAAKFSIDGMILPEGVSDLRLNERVSLLRQVDNHFVQAARSDTVASLDRMHQRAFDVLQSATTRAAFEMEREPAATRDRYGRHKFGQSVLLARRLIEAGVRLVQVNWPREPRDTGGNPLWDTHQDNAGRCKDVLCPQFDGTFAALIADLETRGMLDETLVIVMGEFGRTPKINPSGGRDHWGHVFSVALAGAGIEGGTVIGASDRIGGFPAERTLRPHDLSATIFHLLGLAPESEFLDPIARPRRLSDGTPIRELV